MMTKKHSPDFLNEQAKHAPRILNKINDDQAKKEKSENFHHLNKSVSDKKKAKKSHGWHKKTWIIITVCLFLMVFILTPGISVLRAGLAARAAKASLESAKIKAEQIDTEGAALDIEEARYSLISAREHLQATGFWRDVPGIGLQLRALEDASAAGAETLNAAEDLIEVFRVIVDALRGSTEVTTGLDTGVAPTRSYEDLSKEEKRDLLRKFSAALPNIRMARDKIDIALELWERVPQASMASPLRTALEPLAKSLPILKRTLDEAVPLIETAVPLSGYPERLKYLVLLQNSDEIRPAGGFIGTVGVMTLDAGDLTEFDFTDIYNIDNPSSYAWKEVPPKPMSTYLGIKAWFMRDANWSPDFPESAARLLDFYTREVELGTGKKVTDPPNAILALEPGFFKDLLQIIGPVKASGKTFTADNFFDVLEYEVEQGFLEQGIPLQNRKDLIEKLGADIVLKLKSLPASRWPELVDLMTRALQRKQIMVYAENPELLSILDGRNWTGRTKPTQGDFLWVIDANLAALKTDGMMDKRVKYSLDARDTEKIIATVTLKYSNRTKKIDWRYTRYRSYTRVYVPAGSKLISSKGAMKDDRYKTGGKAVAGPIDVTNELGKTVFGAFWSIEPNTTSELSFTYELPVDLGENIRNNFYRLDWPKQAGADKTQMTLDLNFSNKLKSAVPSEDESRWNDTRYEYQSDSLEDRVFEIKF